MTASSSVPGERTVAHVSGIRSIAVRMQRTLAAALVLCIGAAVLVWYYVHLGDSPGARSASATTGLRSAVASEMRLPALEQAPPAVPEHGQATAPSLLGSAPAAGQPPAVDDAPAALGRAGAHADGRAAVPRPETAAPWTAPHLRQSAPVLAHLSTSAKSSSEALSAALRDATAAVESPPASERGRSSSALGDALQPTVVKSAEAGLVASRRWLLPKGSFLDCTLETAIDSTFAGLTTCILSTDVYGADGRVVLMERGTKLVGETRSDVRTGQARVAILWDEARTPTGVVLSLASPGTDALGRAGVPGEVDRHTGERFGAAVLLSLLDTGIAAVAASHQGTGTIVYNAQDSRDIATEVLRNTIAIPPTIRVAPGARVTVTVVRDIDFRAVYRLVAHAGQ